MFPGASGQPSNPTVQPTRATIAITRLPLVQDCTRTVPALYGCPAGPVLVACWGKRKLKTRSPASDRHTLFYAISNESVSRIAFVLAPSRKIASPPLTISERPPQSTYRVLQARPTTCGCRGFKGRIAACMCCGRMGRAQNVRRHMVMANKSGMLESQREGGASFTLAL